MFWWHRHCHASFVPERRDRHPGEVFLGDQLPAWLLLAFGAALAVGNALALVRPPRDADGDELSRPPIRRSAAMIAVGSACAVWALASLIKSG